MAAPGQTLVNPASGERITFRATSAETNGELVAIDSELPPGGRAPAPPPPPAPGGAVRSRRGDDAARLRRERIVARPGEVVAVPPRVPHDFANDGDRPALVRVEIRPALKMERLFETAVALAEQGRTMLGGIPKPLELALFTREFEQEVQTAAAPRWLLRLALAPLAWLARSSRPRAPPASHSTSCGGSIATAAESCGSSRRTIGVRALPEPRTWADGVAATVRAALDTDRFQPPARHLT